MTGSQDGRTVASAGRPRDRLLAEQVQMVLRRSGAAGWAERDGSFWFSVDPPGYPRRVQGWKLHVSATPLSAVLVVQRAAAVLVAAGCAFKVAMGTPQLFELLSPTADRGSSGKVVTAYPRDDAQFAELAEQLHAATEHLPGPEILSDRAYRPGSLVHYRFGAFDGRTVLSNDGSYESMLEAPDGSLVPDTRKAWFSPPDWAVPPLQQPPSTTGSGSAVLLADRFVVRTAIRHGSKGGVYLGEDRSTGAEVVIKQARPHIGAMLDGTDARDVLRHEAGLLRRLAGCGFTAEPVHLFEQDRHVFLAEEKIAGTTLFDWLYERGATAPGGAQASVTVAELVPVAEQLVALLATLHAEGLVVRDLSPTNVMITPDGQLRLIDLEYVAEPGRPATVIGTPGYAAPEQLRPTWTGIAPAPGQAADLYSLGALLLFLSSGVDPSLAPDGRPLQERTAALVRLAATSSPTTSAFGPALLGLLRDDPAERWSLDRVASFVRMLPAGAPAARGSGLLATADQDRLITDGFRAVVRSLHAGRTDRLWPAAETDADSDPRNVQFGAGGAVALLARGAATLPGDLRPDLRTTAAWLERRLSTGDRLLPGLYFGASGSLWALFDAARQLGDAELEASALRMAATIPVRWPNPDICHGAAGAGLAQLHLWQATGDATFLSRVRDAADGLLAAASRSGEGVRWTIPAGFDSALAGITHYGFAHGVAGIGAFLLAAGLATGDERYLATADDAAATLATVAQRDGEAAWWPTGEEKDPSTPTRMSHWCSGSSGVGTFLARHWRATGDAGSRELAEAAAVAVRRSRGNSTTATCHGLSGDGEFLLDLADILAEPRYRDWAAELAACLHVRAIVRGGLLLVPDETGRGISFGYGTGMAGVLSFLLRLRHGGPRPWMVDPAARPALDLAGSAAGAGARP